MSDYGELRDLRKERDAVIAEMEAMQEKRKTEKRDSLSAEEGCEWDKKKEKAEGLGAEIRHLEDLLGLKSFATAGPTKPDPDEGSAISEIRTYKGPHALADQCMDVYQEAKEPSYRAAKLSEFRSELRATGMSEGVLADGGVLVQTDQQSAILQKVYSVGEIARLCKTQPIGPNSNSYTFNVDAETDRGDGNRRGGIRGYWTAEAGTMTKSKPTFTKVRLDLDKITALVYVTDEQLQDITALDSYLNRIVPEELMFKLEDGIINGSGAGMPQGIIGAGCTVNIAKETGQPATTIVYQNILKMWARAYARSRGSGVWLINQDCEPQLDQLTLNVGTSGIEPRFVAYGPDGVLRIKGRPVVSAEYCATLGTVGDILFGNFNEYLLIDKGGVQSATSIHVQFLTNETAFRFVYRVNGMPWWASALTPKNGTNTVSPFVKLATRS